MICAQNSASVYVANLTAMTVGMSSTDAACPTEWIMDANMPYPTHPDGDCSANHPSTQCVPSVCTGTGSTCAAQNTQTNCEGETACTWYESCPKTLAPAPPTCASTVTTDVAGAADFDACAAVTALDPTCASTVTTDAAGAADFDACAAVTALDTSTACIAIATADATDVAGTLACTYTAAACTAIETADATDAGTLACTYTVGVVGGAGATAQDCITLSIPGTCTERASAAMSDAADKTACEQVGDGEAGRPATDLETPDACNAAQGSTVNPCEYAGKDWRCYLHFAVDQSLRGTTRVRNSAVVMPLKRCPLVGLPVIGEQYVFGITGTCAWRKGDFVALSEVPEAFEPMLSGEDTCPFVNTEGGGSVTLVIMLIVVFPLGSILLFALLARFGPKAIFGGGKSEEGGGDDGGAANPAAKPPAAP